MKNIVQSIYNYKAGKIRRLPCNTNRASMLGYYVPELEGCLRRGVYARTHWKEQELHNVKTQMIFDEGNAQERQVILDLTLANETIVEQQSFFEWKEYNITGHLDGKIHFESNLYPIEIKSMHPNIWQNINTLEDFKRYPWTRSYTAQVNIYMLLENVDQAIFILKNKSSGELKQINVKLDYDLGEACLKTAEQINEHISKRTLPNKIDDRQKCNDCPFKLICLPKINFGEPLKIVDDPNFESRLNRYFELKEQALECNKVYEVIKSESKSQANGGELNINVGNYLLTGKVDKGGAFRLNINKLDLQADNSN